MSQFHTATLKLTGWYLAILMTVSLAFSVVIYEIAAKEFDRPLPPTTTNQIRSVFDIRVDEIRQARADESKANVVGNLAALNTIALVLGTATSYWFAKRTLRPIEEAMESQARFTSDASHELRTPLAVMRTENEIALRDKKPSVSTLKSVISSNLEEVARLQQLTDRLLALSSEQQVEFSQFAVREVFEDALTRHDTAAKQKHISLMVKTTKLQAYGNLETTCDIISILVDNAIKYSPSKTRISINAKQQGNHIAISVTDQGSGIAEEDIEHIFDRFYRADQSRTKQYVEGHGLGLALAKRLADMSHATLSVANHTPHGAVFTLQLPRK